MKSIHKPGEMPYVCQVSLTSDLVTLTSDLVNLCVL